MADPPALLPPKLELYVRVTVVAAPVTSFSATAVPLPAVRLFQLSPAEPNTAAPD